MVVMAVGKAPVVELEGAAHLLMPLRVERMMREFGGISLGADISLQ